MVAGPKDDEVEISRIDRPEQALGEPFLQEVALKIGDRLQEYLADMPRALRRTVLHQFIKQPVGIGRFAIGTKYPRDMHAHILIGRQVHGRQSLQLADSHARIAIDKGKKQLFLVLKMIDDEARTVSGDLRDFRQ